MSRFIDRILNREQKTPSTEGPSVQQLDQRVDEINRWREQYNPLRDLTLQRAVGWIEQSLRGDFAELQWSYFFLEQADATLFALLDRRNSALLGFDWNAKIMDEDDYGSGFDKTLAEEQQQFIREMYDRVENLYEAIEHFELASFRGFSHAQKHRNDMGELNKLEVLDQWNFSRDGMYGNWYWNPGASRVQAPTLGEDNRLGSDSLPLNEFVIRVRRRNINRIATAKIIRKSLGEKDWTSFIEIFGFDPVWVIMPQGVAPEKAKEYYAAGRRAGSAGGAFPNGTDIKLANAQRGSPPFRDFIKYCDEQMVLAGTSGLLTMLTEAGSGTLAGGAHTDTFKAIAAMEAQNISELFQRHIDKVELEKQFPGRPILAYWELAANEKRAPGDILDDMVKARNAGLLPEPKQASEKTGYTLTAAPATPSQPPVIATNKAVEEVFRDSMPAAPSQELLAIARVQLPEAQHRVLEVLAKPFIAIYERAKKENLGAEQLAAELIKLRDEELPKILLQMNADPETAKVLEEIMSSAIANGIEEGAKVNS